MPRRPLITFALFGGSALGLLLACGGGGGGSSTPQPPAATKLHYTNHPSATTADWRLEVESGQDTSRLVLKVLPPAGLVAQGTSFFLTCDGVRTRWVSAAAGTAFDLGAGVPIFKGKAGATAADYQVGIYQKSGTATLGSAPVVLITMDLNGGAQPGTASIAATPGKTGIFLDGSGQNQPIASILVGEIAALL